MGAGRDAGGSVNSSDKGGDHCCFGSEFPEGGRALGGMDEVCQTLSPPGGIVGIHPACQEGVRGVTVEWVPRHLTMKIAGGSHRVMGPSCHILLSLLMARN